VLGVIILNRVTVNKLLTCSRKTRMYGKEKRWAIENNIQLSTPSSKKRNSYPAGTKGMLTTNSKNKTKYKIRNQEFKIKNKIKN
jgi:hypothetical protein